MCKPWYDELHAGVRVERLDLKSARRHGCAAGERCGTAICLSPANGLRPLGRLGLDAASLARLYPALRHLNIVGDTADPGHAGHDLTYQARHGLLQREMPLTLVADMVGAERAYAAAIELMNDAARFEPRGRPCERDSRHRGAAAPWPDGAWRPTRWRQSRVRTVRRPRGDGGGGRARAAFSRAAVRIARPRRWERSQCGVQDENGARMGRMGQASRPADCRGQGCVGGRSCEAALDASTRSCSVPTRLRRGISTMSPTVMSAARPRERR